MDICKYTLKEIIEKDVAIIGYYGAPSKQELIKASRKFPLAPFFDLDLFFDAPQSDLLPESYCHIVRNCIDNALAVAHQLLCIVASTGDENCNAGRYIAHLLQTHLEAPVFFTRNNRGGNPLQPLLCEARGPLSERLSRVMETIITPLAEQERNKAFLSKCEPTAGFWGTPPHPKSILDLFPPTTHIFGWTRCVEQNTPADLTLEMTVPENIPIVFFAQSGCPKTLLAKELARKHNGLFISTDDGLSAAQFDAIKLFLKDA